MSEFKNVDLACFAGAIPAGIGFLLSISARAKSDRHMGNPSHDPYYVEGNFPYPNYEIPDAVRNRTGDYSTQYTPPEHPQLQSRSPGKPTMSYWDIRRYGKMLLVRTLQNVEHSPYNGPIDDLLKKYYENETGKSTFTDEEKDNMKAVVDYAARYFNDFISREPRMPKDYGREWKDEDRYK